MLDPTSAGQLTCRAPREGAARVAEQPRWGQWNLPPAESVITSQGPRGSGSVAAWPEPTHVALGKEARGVREGRGGSRAPLPRSWLVKSVAGGEGIPRGL